MNLQRIHPPEPAFTTTCCACSLRFKADGQRGYADLDGEPFRAYYCETCAIEKRQSVANSNNLGTSDESRDGGLSLL